MSNTSRTHIRLKMTQQTSGRPCRWRRSVLYWIAIQSRRSGSRSKIPGSGSDRDPFGQALDRIGTDWDHQANFRTDPDRTIHLSCHKFLEFCCTWVLKTLQKCVLNSYNFGSFWIGTASSWTWIGSGSDLDPGAEILDRIGSRSNAVQVDRIGSRSKKIGSDYITGQKCFTYYEIPGHYL